MTSKEMYPKLSKHPKKNETILGKENVWDNVNLIECQIEMEKAHEDHQKVLHNDFIKRILEYLSSDLGKQRMEEGRENARKKSNEFENDCEIDRSELNKSFTI